MAMKVFWIFAILMLNLCLSDQTKMMMMKNGDTSDIDENYENGVMKEKMEKCKCKDGYEWVTRDYINECRWSYCVADPNSDGTEDGKGGCTCDNGYSWSAKAKSC